MFEIGNEYNGFKCIRREMIEDIKSEGFIFEHKKTKARLVYLKNDDKNKVFSIGFRTPVSDSTGVPHIIEHSVLCGSKKYPVKEPFVELLKSSVYTFLNAMTMPDHTLYPVASMNEKDFLNLMNVYLDAVFFPNIYSKKEIFMQEGWHYELLNYKDDLNIKGVVYNEMKGVYSNPESVLFYKGMSMLYPDTTYKFEYGGLPSDIPNLTHEQFTDFHRKYYHPSNSYIYLYGDMDPNVCMKQIDEEYLDKFCYSNISSKITLQTSFKEEKEVIDKYPIGENESLDKKCYMSINYSLANSMNMELGFAFKMLEYYLLETPASPLKKEILEAGLCSELYGIYEDDLIQPFMSINIIEMNEQDKDKIKKIVYDTFEKLANDGIDKDLMESIINKLEFEYRKQEEGAKGLELNYSMFKTWLYDEDPLKPLYFEDSIKLIREKFKNGYFENIIKEYFINNNHRGVVLLLPDTEIQKKRDEELKDKLRRKKFAMDDKEIKEIIKNTKTLIKMQGKKDSKEALDSIPSLNLEDLDKEPEKVEIVKNNINDTDVMLYETDTNKIVYFDLTFDTSCVKEEDISYINLLANLLTEVSTKNYSYENLSKEINKYAGNMTFSSEMLSDINDIDVYDPSLCAHVEGLEYNFDKMIELLLEVIENTIIEEDDKIKEVLSRLRVMMEQTFVQAGNATVSKRIMSYYSQSGKYFEKISGIDYYKFICELDSNFEDVKEVVKGKLNDIKDLIFVKNNMHATLVCPKGDYNKYKEKVGEVINRFKVAPNVEKNKYNLQTKPLNEGIMTQSDVQYVGMGYNFKKLGYKYDGSLLVLRQILSLDYLWNEVRVKGGAYGCKLALGINGEFILASYRDPNIKNTVKAYKGIVSYLKRLKNSKDFYKYIVGTIGTLDKPLTSYDKARAAEKRLLRNISYEDILEERKQVLSTTANDIRNYTKLVSSVINKNVICVLGSESRIKENKNLFKRILNLKD